MLCKNFRLVVLFASGGVLVTNAALTRRVPCPNSVHTATNAACCVLFPIVDSLEETFFNGGQCGKEVRQSVRLTFHDAIGLSLSKGPSGGGGADGSIMTFGDIETQYPANRGVADIVKAQAQFLSQFGGVISPGDFIQLAGAVGISNCPGAPRLQFLLGRPNATAPAPDNTIPAPFDSTDVILARLADAGFNPDEAVALLASHSIAASKDIEPGAPFDSTPGLFDTQFFVEVQLHGAQCPGAVKHLGAVESALVGEIRLESDAKLARDARTACAWQSYINNQDRMAQDFSDAMAKLAILGQDPSNMIDCSEVIPQPKPLPAPYRRSVFPPGFTNADVDNACVSTPFPHLPTIPGLAMSIAPI